MDCNIPCCTLVILLAAVWARCVTSVEDRVCEHGIKTRGYTQPKGDINLEYGQPLEILCVLYPSDSYNASFLSFHGIGREIPGQYVSVINDTTLRLYIPKPDLHDGMYTCILKTPEIEGAVCANQVRIALKPLEVENFTCTSYNWNALYCSWSLPHNYVATEYNLSYSVQPHKVISHCPLETKTPTSCLWNDSTAPLYRPAYPYLRFHMKASNLIGNSSWTYNLAHYSIVVPDKVKNLSCVKRTVDSVTLQWSVPTGLEHFPPGLIHNVSYRTVYDDHWVQVDTSSLCLKSKKPHECNNTFLLTLTDLPYPNTHYNISVRSRSGKENQFPHRWSQPTYISPRTDPALPFSPPATDVGSFETVSVESRRDVYLYWREIPPQRENGDDFRYEVVSVEEDGIVRNITPTQITRSSACFHSMSDARYRFKIKSVNNVGSSSEFSEILVPAGNEGPPPPEQVTQIPYGNGTYELSWVKPSYRNVDSYTVFWYRNERRGPCQLGELDWTTVEEGSTMVNVTGLSGIQGYQLGVSANTGGSSSGVAWASCHILPGRGGDAVRKVNVEHIGLTYLTLSLKLECSNRIGVVTGFLIQYCIVHDCTENTTCSGDDIGTQEADMRARTLYNVTGLLPFREYALFVSVISKSKPTLKSRAVCARTLEGTPDIVDPVQITNVTNSSISVRWRPPDNMNGVFRRYLIQWGGQPKNVTDDSPYTLQDLDGYKEYSISVSACTSAGCGEPSKPVTVRTLMGYPGVPAKIKLRFSNSSTRLTWRPPEKGAAGNLTYYVVQFEVYLGGVKKFNQSLNTSDTLAELQWDKCEKNGDFKYKILVRAINRGKEVLEGPWSTPEEGLCSGVAVPTHLTVIIPIVAVLLSLVLCIFCALFSQHVWVKFNRMRDIGVKLPARLGTRPQDESEDRSVHVWNNGFVREPEKSLPRPSPDKQSLLELKEEMELVPEDRDPFCQDTVIENTGTCDSCGSGQESTVPVCSPSPGYIVVAPQPSGYVTVPPLSEGYMMAALPPSSQPSILTLKHNGLATQRNYPDMVSPVNSN